MWPFAAMRPYARKVTGMKSTVRSAPSATRREEKPRNQDLPRVAQTRIAGTKAMKDALLLIQQLVHTAKKPSDEL